jgi:invasion protein IalB
MEADMLKRVSVVATVLLLGAFLSSVAQTQAPAADQPKTGGKWERQSSKDEMTDEKIESFVLKSENEATALGKTAKGSLVVMRQGGLISVNVLSIVPVGLQKEHFVVYRFNEERLQSGRWERNSNGKALSIYTDDAKRLIGKLAESEKFRIEIGVIGGGAVTFIFDLRGLEEHLPALGLTLKKKK